MALTKASLIDVNGQEIILDADGDTSITADTDDQIDFKVGGTDRVTLSSDGKLKVTEIAHITSGSLEIGNGDEKQIFDASGATIQFQTGDTERMRIDSNGHVGIGSTSPSADLYVQSPDDSTCLFAAGGTYAFGINRQGASGTNYGWYQGTTASNKLVIYDGAGTGRFEVTTSSAGFISDRDQKEDITDITYGLDTVIKLKPKKFKFKDVIEMVETDGEKRTLEGNYNIGFIAQEMVEEVPEIVSGTDGQGDMKIDYAAFTSVLTKAIQELKEENDSLKSRIETLEG